MSRNDINIAHTTHTHTHVHIQAAESIESFSEMYMCLGLWILALNLQMLAENLE